MAVRQQGHIGKVVLELPLLPCKALQVGVFNVAGGKGGHIARIALHGVLFLPDGVLVAEGGEGTAQHQEGQQHHARHGGELPPVHGLHWLTTSNL